MGFRVFYFSSHFVIWVKFIDVVVVTQFVQCVIVMCIAKNRSLHMLYRQEAHYARFTIYRACTSTFSHICEILSCKLCFVWYASDHKLLNNYLAKMGAGGNIARGHWLRKRRSINGAQRIYGTLRIKPIRMINVCVCVCLISDHNTSIVVSFYYSEPNLADGRITATWSP